MSAVRDADERELLDRLWRLHSRELLRYGALLVGPHDCYDVVSSAFLKASRPLSSASVESPRPYLFRAVTNEAAHHRRATFNRWKRDLRAVAASSGSAAETDIDVQRAVADLSVRQRAVVYLAYWEDMTELAIADYLGLSAGSVRRHLFRARAHLRKALE